MFVRNPRSARVPALVVATAMLALSPPDATAGTIAVTTTADQNGQQRRECALREAVRAANADADLGGCNDRGGPDTIRLPPGRYVLRRPGAEEDEARTGDLDITAALVIRGAGARRTIVDGGGERVGDRVFHVGSGVGPVAIRGLTVQNGVLEEFNAGGILSHGTLALRGVTVRRNVAPGGAGGIHNGGDLTIRGGAVSGNRAGFAAGGISSLGFGRSLTMRGTVVRGNETGLFGGGIYLNAGQMTLRGVTVRGNEAALSGGGIEMVGGTLLAERSRIAGNDAGTNGGGLKVGIGGDATVALSTVSGNSASDKGGGISLDSSSSNELFVARSTVSDNRALDGGGGIQVTDGDAQFRTATVSGNRTNASGGGYLQDGTIGDDPSASFIDSTITGNRADVDENSSGTGGGFSVSGDPVALGHSILAANLDETGTVFVASHDCQGSVGSFGWNLVGTANNCVYTPGTGDDVGGDSRIDPVLGPLARNGGPTPTHALLPGSPAIDDGGTGPTIAGCVDVDQRGVPRPIGSNCDKGSYERVTCLGRVVDVVGTEGRDRLRGTDRADVFLALGGADRVLARGGGDRACGGEGNDSLRGGAGRDRLAGEEGNDLLDGGPGRDSCDGGPGRNRLRSC